MITFDSSQLMMWLAQLFWPLVRVLALVSTAPIFSERQVSHKVKIGLAAMITWLLAPGLPVVPVTLFSPAGFWLLIQQILIGVALGFTMQLAFAAVRMAGEVIGLQMGLSFATFFDPASRLNMPVLARFLDMLAMLLFLTFNGHLWLLSLLADSFYTLPIGGEPLNGQAFMALTRAAGLIFINGMMLALPIITLLLGLNLALGLLNRISPQLSVFVIGFPLTLSIGMLAMGMLIPLLAPFCEHLFGEVFDLLSRLLAELPAG
ncbi:flagellar biosynthetic protein FliR [Pantoea sp. 1.19]|uniref:flagellar biosynthetic protein FliR n=1 Tax=Pantoea sp. 1.19 TaxID=1925589 RepID=UPI000948CB96|nr:flagellar biosynthetic protein FliR [Pantoea sp. 1.19]